MMKTSSLYSSCLANTSAAILVLLCLLCASSQPSAEACNCEVNLPLDPFDVLGPWHQRHMECGIPPFAYRLPKDMQDKIHAIWVKYEPGDDCEDEQTQTRNVIMSIPEAERFALFKGVCGPGFLLNQTEPVKDVFQKLWFNEALTIEQKQAEFKKQAEALLTGDSKKRFEKFDRQLGEHIKRRTEFLASLSPAAKEAYFKWSGLRKDERKFLAALPAEIRAELGLTCKCCGGCKTGGKTVAQTRATRSLRLHRHERFERSADHPLKTDQQMLAAAAAPECSY